MDIQTLSIDQLTPADYNPRLELVPGDVEFEKLKRSIETFGFVEPVVWNKRTGRVVGGHQRINVARHLGYTELDVVVVDLDEPSEKMLNIALNKISGEWDMPKLKDLLVELDTGELDIELSGFDEAEIERLITQTYQGNDPEPDLTDSGINYQSQFGVIVMCTSETEQEKVYNQLNDEGYSCKVVSV